MTAQVHPIPHTPQDQARLAAREARRVQEGYERGALDGEGRYALVCKRAADAVGRIADEFEQLVGDSQ